jgi:SEC-C motif-containing protein
VLDGTVPAPTAEALMRSRYTAFALGDAEHLLASWHSRTRPRRLDLDAEMRWTGLELLGRTGGTMLDDQGTVEFRASYRAGSRSGAQHERSRFAREDGRWRYLDGVSLS